VLIHNLLGLIVDYQKNGLKTLPFWGALRPKLSQENFTAIFD
jgi:hypothetical protein